MQTPVGPIKKGTSLFEAKPFVYTLTSKHRHERCDNCLNSGRVSKCTGCLYVSYCGRACQKESWNIHKVECPNMKRISPMLIPETARLLSRIIIKLHKGGNDEVGYYTETSFRKFKDLMSHYSDIKKNQKRMEHFLFLSEFLINYLQNIPLPNTAELLGIYGRATVNSFNILDRQLISIGVGIYLGPSIIDHSCKPNVVAVFEGTTIIIRTIEDLPCLDWSQIRISYRDNLEPMKERKEELEDCYHFSCDCKRCENPEPEENAAACQNKSCSYPCPSDVTECPKCGTKFPEDFKQTFDEIVEFTKHCLDDMEHISYLDVCRVCLKKQDGVLHPLNIRHVQTLRAAVDAAIALQSWNEVETYSFRLIPGYLHYYGRLHPTTGMLYLATGMTQTYLEKDQEAEKTLREAEAILKITHGETHSLIREKLKPLLQRLTLNSMMKSLM